MPRGSAGEGSALPQTLYLFLPGRVPCVSSFMFFVLSISFVIFRFNLRVWSGFRGCCEDGHVFLCGMNLELWRNSVWGSIYGGLGGSNTFFVYGS